MLWKGLVLLMTDRLFEAPVKDRAVSGAKHP